MFTMCLLCEFCCTGSSLCLFQISLASLNLVSRGNTSHASKILEPTTMPFVSTIPTYYMVFLRHSKVNCLSATFKQFKIYYLLFVSMFYSSWGSMWCFIFQSCWATFTNGLVASSAYPIILQKELARGSQPPINQPSLIILFTCFALIHQ